MANHYGKLRIFFTAVPLLLILTLLFSLHAGQIPVPATGIPGELMRLFSNGPSALSPEQSAVLWYIRLPRVLVALLSGAALACAGAVMQGLFSNPLADPGIIGVSSGASLGAVIAISMGLTTVSMYYMPFFALAGALVAVTLSAFLAYDKGQLYSGSLLLAGVAVSIFLSALTNGLMLLMNEYKLREFLFWIVGGLDYRRWEHVTLAFLPIIIGIIVLALLARHLNTLSLGDEEARSLGMNVLLYRALFLFLGSFITAFSVCISGMIGFVGLVIPHITRLLLGPDHRILVPASALLGALFLLLCDTIGRLISPPIEVRVGIVTALVGAPYFLYLIRRMRRKGGRF